MSITLDDSIEFMITRCLSLEQCYMEIMLWPEEMQEEGKKILHEKMKEGRFDKAITYHHTTFINPKDPKQLPLGSLQFMSSIKKLPWYKTLGYKLTTPILNCVSWFYKSITPKNK